MLLIQNKKIFVSADRGVLENLWPPTCSLHIIVKVVILQNYSWFFVLDGMNSTGEKERFSVFRTCTVKKTRKTAVRLLSLHFSACHSFQYSYRGLSEPGNRWYTRNPEGSWRLPCHRCYISKITEIKEMWRYSPRLSTVFFLMSQMLYIILS